MNNIKLKYTKKKSAFFKLLNFIELLSLNKTIFLTKKYIHNIIEVKFNYFNFMFNIDKK